MTENQRIKILRKRAGYSQVQLADAMGVDQSTISSVESGKNNATKNFKILLSHILGISVQDIETDSDLNSAINNIETPTIKNEALPHEVISNNQLDNEYSKGIPMYNAPGAGGGVEIYTDPNSDKIVGYLNFPGITKGSFALPVYGHSMYPTLENGVWVVLRPIENTQSINWGEVYYIEYGDYRVFKRLLVSDNNDDVTLWSDNQLDLINDKPKFSPITIKKIEIRKLCLVTDVYKKSNN